MKILFNIIISLLISPSLSFGGGMPVVDTNEMMKQLSDGLYLITSLETLLKEVGGNASELQAFFELSRELEAYQREVRMYQQLGGAIEDVTSHSYGRSKVFSDQINSITRHVRKLKTVLTLAKTFGARPGAVNASMQILRDERMREKERFEVALKALEEKEKISSFRRRLQKRVGLRRSLSLEASELNEISQDKLVRPISFKSEGKKEGLDSLW